jgi:TrmH family RNA methyltransferase
VAQTEAFKGIEITMLSAASPLPLSREKLKTLRSLASAKIRRRKGICLVEGERAIEEAARSGNLVYLVLSAKRVEEAHNSITERFPGVAVFSLDDRYFSELTDVSSGTGILGAARIPAGGVLEGLKSDAPRSIMLYLDGLQEPGNVGGLIRTAWAFGAAGVILNKGTADPFSSKAVRSSAGGVFHMPVFYDVETESLKGLKENGCSIFLADAGGPDLDNVRFPARSILAVGSEVQGFSKGLRDIGRPVGIAMVPGVDSLNVVVAGSIILEKMRRSG